MTEPKRTQTGQNLDGLAESLLSPGELMRLKKATIAHLLDLKRANCSPKFTELRVDPRTDRVLALPQSRPKQGPRPKPSPIAQVAMLRRRTP